MKTVWDTIQEHGWAKEIFIVRGRGAGKTYASIKWALSKLNVEDARIVVLLSDSATNLLSRILDEDGYSYSYSALKRAVVVHDGSATVTFYLDKPLRERSFGGDNMSHLAIDRPITPTEDNELVFALRFGDRDLFWTDLDLSRPMMNAILRSRSGFISMYAETEPNDIPEM